MDWQPASEVEPGRWVLAREGGDVYKARKMVYGGDPKDYCWEASCGRPVVYEPEPEYFITLDKIGIKED